MLGANPIFGRLFYHWLNPQSLKLDEGCGTKSLLLRCSNAISKWVSSNVGARHHGKIQGCYLFIFLAGIERVWLIMGLLILTHTHKVRWRCPSDCIVFCLTQFDMICLGWLRSKVLFTHLFLGGKWFNVSENKYFLYCSRDIYEGLITSWDT